MQKNAFRVQKKRKKPFSRPNSPFFRMSFARKRLRSENRDGKIYENARLKRMEKKVERRPGWVWRSFAPPSLHLRSTFAPPSLPKGSNREGTRALRRRFGGKDMARHGGSGRKGLANRTVSSHSIHSTGHCRDAIITLL